MTDEAPTLRAGICAIVGMPNVGKSTLLNKILGERLVAVSNKPQTTRDRILGVHNYDLAEDPEEPAAPRRAQVAFVDTPGIQIGTGALRRHMREEALHAASECDLALLVLDATDRRGRIPSRLAEQDATALAAAIQQVPLVIALNKVDRMDKPDLLPLLATWHDWARDRRGVPADVVPIAAISGDGVARLLQVIAKHLPLGPALYPDDMLTDRHDRFLAAELIREQLFHQLAKELPYAAAVMIEKYEEREKDVVIGAVIVVERESQKGIVVGKAGSRIKELGIAARAAVAELLGRPVHLELFVKVMPEWSRGERSLRQLGFEKRSESR